MRGLRSTPRALFLPRRCERNRRVFVFAANARHLAIDLLNLRHERLLALGEFNELHKRRGRNAREHTPLSRARSTTQLGLQLAALRKRGDQSAGGSQNSNGKGEHKQPKQR